MAVDGVYSAGAIILQTLDPVMASPIGFAGLTSEAVETGNEVRTGMDAAGIYESRAMITKRAPYVPFGTTQIATALNLMGTSGRCINSDGTHPGLDAYLFAHDRCDARDLTASLRYRIGVGLLTPQTITAEHRGVAVITGRAYACSSEGNEPLEKAENITVDTSGLADTEEYTLYQQTVGGLDLTGCKRMSIECGVTVTEEDADGSIFPEWLSVGSIITRVRLSGLNPNWLKSDVVPMAGKKMEHIDTVLRLVKCANADASSYVALTTAEHIAFTLHGLGYIGTAANANDGQKASSTDLLLVALHDGTNVPLQINTTAAFA